MSFILGMLGIMLVSVRSSMSFYSGFMVLVVWSTTGMFSTSLWTGGLLSVSSWGHSLITMSLVLTTLSIICCLPSSKSEGYSFCLLLVCWFSVLAFLCEGGFLFFLFFEATFFPISLLILMWGYNQERVVAVLYMALYSFFGSIFHMACLSLVNNNMGLVFFSGVYQLMGDTGVSGVVWFVFLVLLFLIKSPLFLWHLWLSKAHVEAPTGASMVLAAILLKLGLFGLIGYGAVLSGVWLGSMLQVLGLFGAVFASLVCMRSQNIKLVIAQSSVAHMSLCVSAFFSGGESAIMMSCLMGVVHGFCSAGMFAWAGRYYSFGGSQSSLLTSGQRLLCLEGSVIMMFLLVCNAGVPPFISFWVELVFFNVLYFLWSTGGYLIVGVSMGCMMFSIVFGLNAMHGGVEVSQGKRSRYPVNEVIMLSFVILVLFLGYFF